MRKFGIITCFFAFLFIYGCESWAERGSTIWETNAPANEVDQYYKSKSVVDLCIMWKDQDDNTYVHLKRRRLNNIANELQARGHDPMYCERSNK